MPPVKRKIFKENLRKSKNCFNFIQLIVSEKNKQFQLQLPQETVEMSSIIVLDSSDEDEVKNIKNEKILRK